MIKQNMRKLICLFFFILNLIYAQSQTLTCDKIVCINGEEIEAIISEITPDFITYKKCDNVDGPKYSIEKTKVFVIKYKNGTKEVINDLNNPIASTKVTKKIKKPHNKFYKGVELHYDRMYNVFESTNNIKKSYNLYSSFLVNYKLNMLIEFDGSVGLGIGSYNFYKSNFSYSNYYISNLENPENDFLGGFLGIGNLGVRVNYLNFIENKNRICNPFLKPELSIRTAYKNPILSYSILTGININKLFTISLGYKYTPMKAVTKVYSNNSESKSVVGFHNVLCKISFEF